MLIFGIILCVLFLLSLVRVGGRVDFSDQGLQAFARVGAIQIQVFPLKKKDKAPKEKKPKKKKEPPTEGKPKTGGALSLVREFLPLACDAAGRLRRKIQVDQLDIDLTMAAAGDPAKAALAYGRANAILGMFLPLLENNFNIKERSIRTAVDFNCQSTVIAIRAALSLTIGQTVAFGVHFGLRSLKILLKWRREQKAQQKITEENPPV